MITRKILLSAVGSAMAATPSMAQDAPVPFGLQRALPGYVAPDSATANVAEGSVTLSALVTDGSEPIEDGLAWHVFERKGSEAGELVASREGGAQTLRLVEGEYVAHVSYGRASAVAPFTVTADGAAVDPIVLNAGGLRLIAESAGTTVGQPTDVRFSIYEVVGDGRRLVLPEVAVDQTVQLGEGVYRVVAQYGQINAVAGADIRVRAGEITEATLGVPGAEVTLNLVRNDGGVPLASTAWRVFGPDGTPLFESDQPAPSVILAEGSYTTEVLHNGQTFSREFDVRAGDDSTVSLLAE